MSSNERVIGFSSGALDPGEPGRAIEESLRMGLTGIELSALRMHELDGVARALTHPRLASFSWVSIHAPSRVPPELEADVVDRLVELAGGRIPIVVHPDVIREPGRWDRLGPLLVLENMDRRKAVGRFADEFSALFQRFPAAGLCLDVAHVRQVDPTLTEGLKFLKMFGARLREIHISEVTSSSSHGRISLHALGPLRDFLTLIPASVPTIVESVLGECRPMDEVSSVSSLLGESAAGAA